MALSAISSHHREAPLMDSAVHLVLLVTELSEYLRDATAEQNGFLFNACSQVFLEFLALISVVYLLSLR